MKSIFFAILFLISLSTAQAAPIQSQVKVLEFCHLTQNPDSGVYLQVFDVGQGQTELGKESGLFVAVLTSAGNVRPHVLAAFPVVRIPPSGVGVTGFESADQKSFYFSKNLTTQTYTLKSSGAVSINLIVKAGRFSSCN